MDNYEQKYKEALDRATAAYKDEDRHLKESIVRIFPELKESEDERIRKDIIATIHLYYGEPLEDEAKEMIAWLEKQGEHKKFRDSIQVGDKVTRNQDGVLVNLSQLKRVAKPADKQCEQKPADLKTKAGNWYACNMEVVNENVVTAFHRDEVYYCPKDGYIDVGGALFEVGSLDVFRLATEKEIPQPKQNPAWSEEDERERKRIIGLLEGWLSTFKETCYAEDCKCGIVWLKSLKERVQLQPKQEWSEEDENTRKKIIKFLKEQNYFDGKANEFKEPYKKEYDWLKSLRPQNKWKPDSAMLVSLQYAINHISKIGDKNILLKLLEQLKKLK